MPGTLEHDPDNIADRIYEASVLPDLWPKLLESMATATTAGDGIIFAVKDADVHLAASSDRYRKDALEFFSLYPQNERTRRLLAAQRARFVTDFEVFSVGEREALPIFRDFFIPRGYGDGVATAIPMPSGETVVVHLEGRYTREPFSRKAVAWLDDLRPHLARSALLSARLAFERARTAVETLSALGLAACAVQDNGAVLVANAEFERETAFWTTRGGGRLALHDRGADRLLAEGLARSGAREGVRSIPLRAAGESPPAVLHLVPVRRAAHDLFGRAAAILVLSKPVERAAGATPLLQALFDLTATEADLAARIAAGQTVGEMAAADGKSVATVRNQLKSVLDKTGCRRQADLARVLVQLLPSTR